MGDGTRGGAVAARWPRALPPLPPVRKRTQNRRSPFATARRSPNHTSMPEPTVSCVMPTRTRHGFLPRAVAAFLAQGAPDAELLVVSEDGMPHSLTPLLDGRRVRHVRCPAGMTLGAKRNFACEAARGRILVHWDDDDLHAGDRLARQVPLLLRGEADLCGSSRVLFHEPSSGRTWEYRYAGARCPWVYGATLAYTRDLWLRRPFEDVNVGEDNGFVWAATPGEVAALDDPDLCLCVVHPGNTSVKATDASWWRPIELPERWREAAAALVGQADG
ncbi:MAG: glycosyltransferase family 2 protein [Gemmatimonadetes bacterium]|nr:glycosyltransferase family 2 protein [Gemmatimonadota bacterium]